jgi:hypothetical protein
MIQMVTMLSLRRYGVICQWNWQLLVALLLATWANAAHDARSGLISSRNNVLPIFGSSLNRDRGQDGEVTEVTTSSTGARREGLEDMCLLSPQLQKVAITRCVASFGASGR